MERKVYGSLGDVAMRAVLEFTRTFLVFCVRGGLLWIVLPLTALAWLIGVIPLVIVRLVTGRDIHVGLLYFLRYGTQVLNASLSRMVFPDWPPEPWPWVEPPTRSSSTGLGDAL